MQPAPNAITIDAAWTRDQLERNLSRVLNPAVGHRAMEALKKPSSDFVQIAGILQGDPFIAAKVVGLANLLRRGGEPTIASVQRAVQVLGVRHVQTLVYAVLLTGPLASADADVPRRADLWRWVFGCAAAGDYIARSAGAAQRQDQRYLVCGLMMGLGPLVLHAGLGRAYGGVLGTTLRPLNLATREARALGVTHHRVTLWALESMRCPTALGEHAEALADGRDDEAVLRARAVEMLAARAVGFEAAKAEAWLVDALPRLGLSPEEALDQGVTAIRGRVRELRKVYDVDLGDWAQQQESRQSVMLAAGKAIEDLLAENLTQSAPCPTYTDDRQGPLQGPLVDPLTGVLTRRGWEEHLRDTVPSDGASLAVLVLDIDGFRDFNTRFGRPDADRALGVVATLLRSTQAEPLLVARTGDDEFAAVYPARDAAAAAGLIEEIRGLLADPDAAVDDTNLTATIGAVLTSGGRFHGDPHDHLHRARINLQQARTLGRDRSRLTVHGTH